MKINYRLILACLVGVSLMIAGLVMEGGHASAFIQPACFIAVVGPALFFLAALRGPRAVLLIAKASLLREPLDSHDRDEVIEAIEVLECTTFLGGFTGLFLGFANLIADFWNLSSIGPSVAFAICSLVYSIGINAFFTLPLKQSLLADPSKSRSSTRDIQSIFVRGGVFFVLIVLWIEVSSLAGFGHPIVPIPGLLMAAAPLACTIIVLRGSLSMAADSANRQLWSSNSLICGAMLAPILTITHILAQLDNPAAITPGLYYAVTPIAYALSGAVLLRLYRPRALTKSAGRPQASHPYLYVGFAALTAVTMACMMGLVIYSLDSSGFLDRISNARPR